MGYGTNPISGRLKTERKKRRWDIPRMALELRKASDQPEKLPSLTSLQRNIERWESGQIQRISEWYRLLYATAFDIPDNELFPQQPHQPRQRTISRDDEDMERRRLLAALVTLGAAAPAVDALSTIHDSVDKAVGINPAAHIDEWEEIVAEYGHTFLTRPAAELMPELAADLVSVRTHMAKVKPSDPLFASWCRVVSGLSTLLAKSLSAQHRQRESRTWWATAQQAADNSGDTTLSLWVAGEHAIHGIYEQRPTAILLRRMDDAIDRAGDTATPRGLVTVLSARAQLLALQGRSAEADSTLNRLGELYAQLPTKYTNDQHSIVGWGEERLGYVQAYVHAHLGEADKLDAAATRAHSLTPTVRHRYRVQLQLLRGFGRVRAGDVSEGVQHAQSIIEADPAAGRSLMAATIARDVLNAVPAAAQRGPLVTGYRELLAGDSPKSIA